MAEKTYKNISNAPVLGNPPGKVFKADIPDAQLKRMIARHSIKEVGDQPVETTEEKKPDGDAPEESKDNNANEGGKGSEQKPPLIPPGGKKGN